MGLSLFLLSITFLQLHVFLFLYYLPSKTLILVKPNICLPKWWPENSGNCVHCTHSKFFTKISNEHSFKPAIQSYHTLLVNSFPPHSEMSILLFLLPHVSHKPWVDNPLPPFQKEAEVTGEPPLPTTNVTYPSLSVPMDWLPLLPHKDVTLLLFQG